MQDNVFDLLKNTSEDMAAVNFQVDAKLKRNFKKVCKVKDVTMTAALIKFMEVTVYNARVENLGYKEDIFDLED